MWLRCKSITSCVGSMGLIDHPITHYPSRHFLAIRPSKMKGNMSRRTKIARLLNYIWGGGRNFRRSKCQITKNLSTSSDELCGTMTRTYVVRQYCIAFNTSRRFLKRMWRNVFVLCFVFRVFLHAESSLIASTSNAILAQQMKSSCVYFPNDLINCAFDWSDFLSAVLFLLQPMDVHFICFDIHGIPNWFIVALPFPCFFY